MFISRVNSESSSGGNYFRALVDLGMAVVLAACAAIILASVFWYCELVTHFMVYLFGAACLVSLANLLSRRWWRLLVCSAAAIFTGLSVVPFVYPKAEEEAISAGRVFTALHLNLQRDNPRPEEVTAYLGRQKADLILLEEVTPAWERRLRPLFGEYQHEILQTRDHAFGIWLLSRGPLLEAKVLPGEDSNVPYVTAVVELGGQRLRFVGVHPVPPTGRMKAKDRNDRLFGASEIVRKEKGHRMVLGDLNCTPWSPFFKRLLQAGHLVDTSVGRGLHATWHPGLPFVGLPIDHCLVSPSVVVVSRTIGPDVGSDHRPLRVEFSLLIPAPGKE